MEGWQRTLRVLWVVQFLTTLAMTLGLTFVPFFLAEDPVLRVTDDAERTFYTGLILAGPFFTTIVFTPIWGWVADRSGPKRQVVRACFGLGATQLLMAIAQSPDQMVAIRMLQGAISGVLAAALGLVAVVTPRAHQGRSIAILQSSTPAGQIFGPVLGGILATAFGFRITYAILGTLIMVTGVLAWRLLHEEGFVPTQSPNPFIGLARAGRTAVRRPLLRLALVILVVGQFAFTVAQGVFAIFAGKVIDAWALAAEVPRTDWNRGVAFTALAMSLSGLASVVSSPWWGHMHDRRMPFLTPIGATLMAVSWLLLVAWPAWWLVLVARVGVGLGIGAVSTLQFAVLARGVAQEERGQMMGLATALNHVGNLVGFLSGGILATWWGEGGNFALAAAGYLFVAVTAVRLELRERLRTPLLEETPTAGA